MRRVLTVLALALPFAALSLSPAGARPVDRAFGQHGIQHNAEFSDPIVPDPPLSVPPTPSCQVTLISNYPFENFTPATGSYAPPAGCPGPWSKVVLSVTTSVKGIQFDRVGALWIGNTEIYRFTTSEPPQQQIQWTTQKDVTEYANALSAASTYTYSLGNVVNSQYTGIYYVTATLTFYEPASGYPPASVPDAVIPIAAAGSSPPWYTLSSPTQQASSSVTVPPNTQNAVLELYASGHICEEFWYANESTAFESQLGSSCGGTAYREIQVYVDNKPAGVALPYPYLYTGAIDPIGWLPLTGYDTLDIPPYVFDLTPFVGYLNDGNPHTIAAQVYNDTGGFWLVDGDLLITEDHGSKKTHGKLLSLTGGFSNPETYWENFSLSNGGSGYYAGADSVEAKGYVDTSQGRVTTSLSENIATQNGQVLTDPESSSGGTETVTMNASSQTVENVSSQAGGNVTYTTKTSWPFYLGLTSFLAITQPYHQTQTVTSDGSSSWATKDVVVTTYASGSSQETSVNFQLHDSSGGCYNRTLTASEGKLQTDKYACGGTKKSPRR
jgi:hypothetical protein